MCREIKFRSWNYKKMIYNIAVRNSLIVNHPDKFDYKNGEANYKIMQFTGRIDKNGIDVYEGDIIPYHFNETTKGVVKYGNYNNPCDDEFANHVGFYLEFNSEHANNVYRKDLGYWLKTSYVVGNIYENPELLKP